MTSRFLQEFAGHLEGLGTADSDSSEKVVEDPSPLTVRDHYNCPYFIQGSPSTIGLIPMSTLLTNPHFSREHLTFIYRCVFAHILTSIIAISIVGFSLLQVIDSLSIYFTLYKYLIYYTL